MALRVFLRLYTPSRVQIECREEMEHVQVMCLAELLLKDWKFSQS